MAKKKSKHADTATAVNGKKGGKNVKEAPAGPGKVAEFKDFLEQSWHEMKKVTYPTRKETIATSVAVLVMVVFMSLFLGLVDLGLAKAIEAILS